MLQEIELTPKNITIGEKHMDNFSPQTRFTRAVALVDLYIDMPGDTATYLFAILRMHHCYDDTSHHVHDALLDRRYIAWARDKIIDGEEIGAEKYKLEAADQLKRERKVAEVRRKKRYAAELRAA